MPRNANIIGRNVAKFRYQAGWTQEFLAAKMQVLGCYISRDIIANIETRRSAVTDKRIAFFAAAFRVPPSRFFPAGLTLNWPKDQ
ncbi:MAG TPA: helix-turn-helix transcriptional regulator [Candidatus Aquilonibacter sp.]|nr:helix-turn-helix transcriptional regulator [Candidatus Aquilonibacter sp.]